VNECGDIFQNFSPSQTSWLAITIYSLLITVIHNQSNVSIHQQHITTTYIINKPSPQGTQGAQDVCTILFLLWNTILGLSATMK
jgi:hypothetical protein